MADAYDYGELVVVAHHDSTGPGALTPTLDGRASRRPWRLVRPDQGAPLPAELDRIRGVLVLGGPMGVADADHTDWLRAELDWLAGVLEAGIPVFGICLGHQLLAHVLGGRVARRQRPEIGLVAVRRTAAAADDPVWAGWPDGATVLMVHDDEVVALPDGAVEVAVGADGVTAFRAADSYGVQFHPEATVEQLEAWLARDPDRAARAGVDPAALLAEVRRRIRFLHAVGIPLVGRWLDRVVGRDDPTPRRRRSER